MLRVLAEYNPERLVPILNDWHLRDVLLAYEAHLREQAIHEYGIRRLEYAMVAPWASKKLKPPKRPALLRGEDG